jgi:hypothetical protein
MTLRGAIEIVRAGFPRFHCVARHLQPDILFHALKGWRDYLFRMNQELTDVARCDPALIFHAL